MVFKSSLKYKVDMIIFIFIIFIYILILYYIILILFYFIYIIFDNRNNCEIQTYVLEFLKNVINSESKN